MLIAILIINILTFALLLMWLSAWVQEVAKLKADIEMMSAYTRHAIVSKLVEKEYKSSDVEGKTFEELLELL